MEQTMMSLVTSLGTWNWFIAGVLLLILEMIAPGAYMLWLGLAALVVGGLTYAVDMTWQVQCAVFVVLAAAAFPLWRHFSRRPTPPTDQPFLNSRAQAIVGRVFTLDKPLIDGSGTVAVGDGHWRVSGPDLPAGRRVRVVRADGANLFGEASQG
jgi:membrane protein implicated in regulation of membrane protease activity